VPYRTFKLHGAECWLFFVGGASARAAWLATPWDEAWGKEKPGLPGVSAGTQANVLEDGVVFERVDQWPRAVRVTGTKAVADGVMVTLESIAVRDQPRGMTGTVVVHDDITGGSMPTADPAWKYHPEVLTGALRASDAAARTASIVLQDAAAQKAATAMLKKGIAGHPMILEGWQNLFFRPVEGVASTRVRDALAEASQRGCRFDGTCMTAESIHGEAAQGAIVVPDGKTFRIQAVVVAPLAVSPSKEPTPVPIGSDELAMAFRTEETPTGTLRPAAAVAVGERHVFVASDDHSIYLVERDGPFSRVSSLGYKPEEKTTVEAKLEDVDGDGINDVLLLVRWSNKDPDPYLARSRANVIFRTADVMHEPHTSAFDRDIDVVGATDLADLQRRAHAPVTGATISSAEACSVLGRSSTPAGLVANAIAGARLVMFSEPQSPSYASRVVRVAHATIEDAAHLKDACTDTSEGGFSCRDGLCGNLDYGLGSFYRFVREGRTIKLETALIYVGS
jgi:hypothetical protein